MTAFRGSSSESTRQAKNLLSPDGAREAIGNWSTNATVPLNANNTLHLRVVALRTDSTLRALGLYTTISGLMLGHEWKHLGGIVNTSNTGLTYQIHLLHEWKLLGAGIYTSSEEYAGRLNNVH
ncbi:hypothetical protein MUN84_08230 [Hymenobacter sp. 5516J-16]|uniref:hypothetical protein n=1 Tax=Hymenobacter sp. 5516J-16 TaxID=2932253 RepID=UPI001FD1FA70|nr:hypothetical protein [Hymenobacter sp. 5516J-16]UOQ78526.1 hypothetical protein MUN84_08230 [Hymenobacter sp. 5516J-16]